MFKHLLTSAVVLMLSLGAFAQEFPAAASTPKKDEIQAHLADKVFAVALANGQTWRLDFKKNGYFFVDTSTGFNGKGEWNSEDGKLCSKLTGRDRDFSCADARMHEGVIHIRRADGEIIRYVSK